MVDKDFEPCIKEWITGYIHSTCEKNHMWIKQIGIVISILSSGSVENLLQ